MSPAAPGPTSRAISATPITRLSERPRPDRLRVEHLATAFGIDTARPRLSWWLPDGAGQQSGYRIRTDNGWDSGHVPSGESVLVGYGGPPLRSGERVSWQVKVWTEQGESEWSAPQWFELGLLRPGDWLARWITPAESGPSPAGQRPAIFVRGEFGLGQPVVRARLSAWLGYVERAAAGATGFLATPQLLPVLVPPGTTAEVALPDGSLRTVASGRHTFGRRAGR